MNVFEVLEILYQCLLAYYVVILYLLFLVGEALDYFVAGILIVIEFLLDAGVLQNWANWANAFAGNFIDLVYNYIAA